MLEDVEQRYLYGAAAIATLAVAASFAAGYLLADPGTGPTGQVTADTNQLSTADIEDSVISYVDTATGGQADVEVQSVQESDIAGLYEVQLTMTAAAPGPEGETQEMTQDATMYATTDGQYLFPDRMDLQNPPEPQMPQQPPQQPEEPQQ